MKHLESTTDYWFTIDPYVYLGLTNACVVLYNTLDGVYIESENDNVINLLRELSHKENCGVVLITNEQLRKREINDFIKEVRNKFMGDMIDVTLSKKKPIQLLPYYNYFDKHKVYDAHLPPPFKSILENLFEISIHVDTATNVAKLISVLQSISGISRFNLVGNIETVLNYNKLLSFLNQHLAVKYVFCSYQNVIHLPKDFENNFSYEVSVRFPLDIEQWNISREILLNQIFPFEYVFEVSSEKDVLQVEMLAEQFQIENYCLKPIFVGNNIRFFEENVFLTKKDILSASISIKDFYIRQSMNIYDFGKVNIMPNGDAYANVNHPMLGNVYMHSIYEIVKKEIDEGISWLRVRNQSPCNNCVYQWLCPPPSDYEIIIGRSNLCHVK